MKDLTARQREIWEWMIRYQRERGKTPTLREVCNHFGFKSTNAAVDGHFVSMLKKGYVKRTEDYKSGAWRAIDPLESLPLKRVGTVDFSLRVVRLDGNGACYNEI